MRVSGHHRNLGGNYSAMACEAVLVQRDGYRVHGTGASTGPVTGDYFPMLDGRIVILEVSDKYFHRRAEMGNNKARPGTNPDADDRGVGEDTIGKFLLEPFQALSFTDPLECGCGGLQETAFSPGGDLTTIHRIDGCLSQPPTARSRRFAQEWQRCFVEAQRSRLPGESSETAQGLGQGSSVSSWMPAYPSPCASLLSAR